MNLDICCFGFISALEILKVERYPDANSRSLVTDTFGIITPDAPIVALLASYLGLDIGLVSYSIGNDMTGQQLTRLLQKFSIISTVVNTDDTETPQTIVVCDQENNRTWFSFLPMAEERLLQTDLSLFNTCKLAYIDVYEIIRMASIRVIRYAINRGIPMFLNLGGDPLTEELVALLDKSEIAIIQTSLDKSGEQEALTFAKELHNTLQPQITIVTLAEAGTLYLTRSADFHVPAYQFQTIHSNGAGAAFSAGFAYAFLRGYEIHSAVRFASALGGMYCTVHDGFGRFLPQHIWEFIEQRGP